MNKNIKLASVITLISLMLPICVVLLLESSRIWVLTAPIWLLILFIGIALIVDKVYRNKKDNYKVMKFVILTASAILIALGMYLTLLLTR